MTVTKSSFLVRRYLSLSHFVGLRVRLVFFFHSLFRTCGGRECNGSVKRLREFFSAAKLTKRFAKKSRISIPTIFNVVASDVYSSKASAYTIAIYPYLHSVTMKNGRQPRTRHNSYGHATHQKYIYKIYTYISGR